MPKKLVTFAILNEKTPSTEKDRRTKLMPGVYMGWFGDERQETVEIIMSLEDDVLYAKEHEWLNGEIENVYPGQSLPPMTKEARMEKAQALRAEIGVGVEEVLELEGGDENG